MGEDNEPTKEITPFEIMAFIIGLFKHMMEDKTPLGPPVKLVTSREEKQSVPSDTSKDDGAKPADYKFIPLPSPIPGELERYSDEARDIHGKVKFISTSIKKESIQYTLWLIEHLTKNKSPDDAADTILSFFNPDLFTDDKDGLLTALNTILSRFVGPLGTVCVKLSRIPIVSHVISTIRKLLAKWPNTDTVAISQPSNGLFSSLTDFAVNNVVPNNIEELLAEEINKHRDQIEQVLNLLDAKINGIPTELSFKDPGVLDLLIQIRSRLLGILPSVKNSGGKKRTRKRRRVKKRRKNRSKKNPYRIKVVM